MCDQLWRTHIEGQARVKAEQSSSTQTGEKQAALRRELHAQIAACALQLHLLGLLGRSIFKVSRPRKKIGCVKSCELQYALSISRKYSVPALQITS